MIRTIDLMYLKPVLKFVLHFLFVKEFIFLLYVFKYFWYSIPLSWADFQQSAFSQCVHIKATAWDLNLTSASPQQVQEVGLHQTVIITNGCKWILGTGSRSVLLQLKADTAAPTGLLNIGCSTAIQGETGNHTTKMETSGWVIAMKWGHVLIMVLAISGFLEFYNLYDYSVFILG